MYQGGGYTMRNKLSILLGLILFVFPNLVFADCVDVRGFTSWSIEGGHSIVLYREYTPLAFLDLQNCSFSSNSSIRIIKTYICDSDKIVIDGEPCAIWAVRSARFSY